MERGKKEGGSVRKRNRKGGRYDGWRRQKQKKRGIQAEERRRVELGKGGREGGGGELEEGGLRKKEKEMRAGEGGMKNREGQKGESQEEGEGERGGMESCTRK